LEKNFEVENFQFLTMIFSGNFLSVEIFLEWKWALKPGKPVQKNWKFSGITTVENLSF
jgi:hypothetical protein